MSDKREKFSLPHEFTSRKISPWGGIKFFHGAYQSVGVREMLSGLPLPRPDSNRGYMPEVLIEGFLCSVILGSRRLTHTGMLRTDAIIKEIFGWRKGTATYQAESWDKPRNMVLMRIPKAEVKSQPAPSEAMNEYERYDYKAFVTNVGFSASLVHALYNKRANAENRIKDLKYDYGIEGFALTEFAAMEAAFRYVMVAYNIMAIFKQHVMQTKKGRALSTIRFQCIAIGSYLIEKGGKLKLKLAATGKRRHFLKNFFDNLEVLHPPFVFSNA